MIKTLMRSIREYKVASILTPLFIALEVVMECMIPLVMTYILNKAKEETPNTTLIIILSVSIIVLGMFSLLFGVLSGKFGAVASAGFAKI